MEKLKKATFIFITLLFFYLFTGIEVFAQQETWLYSVTEEEAYERIMAMEKMFPDGIVWDEHYGYSSLSHSVGQACAAFAHILSDAAFGDLPIQINYNLDEAKIGDMLILNGETHVGVIIGKNEKDFIIAEGNLSGCVS